MQDRCRRVAKRYRLICFDEFHADVADAMILHRLLAVRVMTSSTLCIVIDELIQARMDVMDAGVTPPCWSSSAWGVRWPTRRRRNRCCISSTVRSARSGWHLADRACSDHRVKLIMSAECEPEEIYTEGALANEFHRTVSRILEMQSREYLESERRLTVTL